MKLILSLTILVILLTFCYSDDQLENIWAVIIAGSNGWYNYRHQADVSHAYHLLINHGVLPEKIITLMYDDIANNPQNPYMGKIYNNPDGKDVYNGVKIDYRGGDVNSEIFLNVLKGNSTGNKNKGTGRVLKSTKKEHVFIYYSDHGGTNILGMPTGMLTKHDLDKTLSHMYENDMYNNLLFYLEACESGSMFEGLPEIMRIYAITAARHDESSYATFCDNELNLPCLGDEFSVNWIHNTEINDILKEKVGNQVDEVVKETKLSHVCQFGDKTLRNESVSDFQGKETIQKLNVNINDEKEFKKQIQLQSIDSRQVQLIMAERTMRKLGATPDMITETMSKYMAKREQLTNFVYQIIQKILPTSNKNSKELLYKIMNKVPKTTTQLKCHDKVIKTFDQLCAPFDRNPYAFKMSSIFANVCEYTRSTDKIIQQLKDKCSNGPVFEDVL